jgi:hypothetical protein
VEEDLAEIDAADVDWKATAENLQREVTRLNLHIESLTRSEPHPGDSDLVAHAKHELDLLGLDDPKNDFYGGMTRDAVLELVRVFANQGHSGMSAPLVIGMIEKLMQFEPLSPLTGAPEEWNELGVRRRHRRPEQALRSRLPAFRRDCL